MILIKRISTEDGIARYEFGNSAIIHNDLINFLNYLRFESDEIDKIDTPFSELGGECLFVRKEGMKIHFFICENKVTMVVDSDKSVAELSELMGKHFVFPS